MMSVVRWKFLKNYVKNFSFENEDLENSGLAKNWNKSGNLNVELSHNYYKEGYYSQKIYGNSGSISQSIIVSDRKTNNFNLIFYTEIVSGSLKVSINCYNEDDEYLGTSFQDTYNTSGKYEENFTLYSDTYKVILNFEINTNNSEIYLDSVILYEDSSTNQVEINPTTFSYSKESTHTYETTISGDEVKIQYLDYAKRTKFMDIKPVWMWLSEDQKNIFEEMLGEDFVIITHEDKIFWVDIEKIDVNYKTETVPQIYEVIMTLSACNR